MPMWLDVGKHAQTHSHIAHWVRMLKDSQACLRSEKACPNVKQERITSQVEGPSYNRRACLCVHPLGWVSLFMATSLRAGWVRMPTG